MKPDDLDAHIRSLGSVVETITGADGAEYSVVRTFTIPHGSLAGQTCDIAIQRANAIPYVTPSAIHTYPALVAMDMGGPLKTQPSPVGDGWQYWSRRLDRPATPRTVWTHIVTILSEV